MDMEIHDRDEFALPELDYSEPPAGSDRRSFMMRSAMAASRAARCAGDGAELRSLR